MTCPKCGGKTRVIDSRADEGSVYRKRKCRVCGHILFTAEDECDPFRFHRCKSEYQINYLKERRENRGE